FAQAQVVIHSPAVRPDNKYLIAARNAGAEVTQEMSLFIEACPAKSVGITGSNGKTTTTLLCYEMLCEIYERAQPELEGKWADPVAKPPKTGKRVWLGGNVGTPLINRLEEITKDDVVVLELSSFQLMDGHRIKKSCDVALITNITPNHLDWHKDFEEYVRAKSAVYRYSANGWAIFNLNGDGLGELAKERRASGSRVYTYSSENEADWVWSDGPDHAMALISCHNDQIRIEDRLYDTADTYNPFPLTRQDLRLPGRFNWSNAVGAIAACIGVIRTDYEARAFCTRGLRRFRCVEHRLELCGELNGALVYNDSIATDPAATLAALSAFDWRIHLILGGGSKNVSYAGLCRRIVAHRGIKAIYLQGATAPAIKAAITSAVGATYMSPLHECSTFDEACERAFAALQPGDVLLMSPASTSFYEYAPGKKFANFEERGKHFKALIAKKLSEPRPEGRGPGNA
ncbi:partial UDP-N-acetylmuramoylalanine--D-glutamate ligase, partial [Planctomycetaceae bacterium]